MPRLVLQSASLWRGLQGGCGLLLTLPMGGVLSLALMTGPFESGMPRLVLQSAASKWAQSLYCRFYSPDGRHIISGSMDKTIRIWDADTGAAVNKPLEGHTEAMCGLLPTLPMGGTSSLDLVT
jgi:WD40 repeat protein